jgi:hypothetical protein
MQVFHSGDVVNVWITGKSLVESKDELGVNIVNIDFSTMTVKFSAHTLYRDDGFNTAPPIRALEGLVLARIEDKAVLLAKYNVVYNNN